jgi:hypothetical protein
MKTILFALLISTAACAGNGKGNGGGHGYGHDKPITPVPEPGTTALVGGGLVAAALIARRRGAR